MVCYILTLFKIFYGNKSYLFICRYQYYLSHKTNLARVCNKFKIRIVKETSKTSNMMLYVLISSYSERRNDRIPFSGSDFIVKREA